MKLKTATLIALMCVIIHTVLVLVQRLVIYIHTNAGLEWFPEIIIFNGGLILFFTVLYRKQE